MRLFSMVCEMVLSFDSIALASALTVTVSSIAPTDSVTPSVSVSAVCSSMPSRAKVLKPCSAAVTRYRPGISDCTVNAPLELLTASLATLVSVLTAVTVTPGITEP
jgi:hypothetical protein